MDRSGTEGAWRAKAPTCLVAALLAVIAWMQWTGLQNHRLAETERTQLREISMENSRKIDWLLLQAGPTPSARGSASPGAATPPGASRAASERPTR